MSIIIGVDIGTTHIKAIAYSEAGELLHEERVICKTIKPAPDRAEQDPEIIFQSLISLLQTVFISLRNESLAGVCFSAGMHSIMAVDQAGEPITNAILWGDTRSIRQARTLKDNGLAAEIGARSGVPIHPSLPLCKIMWLREQEPEIFSRSYKFISLKEYVFLKLFGKYVVDHSIAAATGFLDLHTLQWNELALKTAGIREDQLSHLVSTTHSENLLLDKYRDYFNLKQVAPFIIGSSDGCLANIGTGVWNPGKAALTIGTSGAVRTTGSRPLFHPKQSLFCYPLTEDLFVTGGATNNGGYVLQWYARNFLQRELVSEEDYDWFVKEAHKVPAGAEGLIFLPYLQGERAPIWDAEARGVFFGLNALHRQQNMMRAVIEGVSFALYQVFQSLEESSGHIGTICASGGFVQSPLWVQMLADIFNRRIMVTNIADASSIGAALLGFYALGAIKSWDEVKDRIPEGKIYYAIPSQHADYMKYFEIYRNLYPALRTEFQKLGSLVRGH